ncbi:MAG: class I SAM-dependent methyltransferase [Candidatus Sericytochromatia bacterium]
MTTLPPADWGADPEFFGPRHAFRESILLGLMDQALPGPARVLDVGAGAGSFARALASQRHTVTGLEASEGFIAHAERLGGASYVLGDATALPFGDASFDAVVAGEVLEHLEDDQGAIRELFRVLAPGGTALVSVPADPERWDASDDWAGHVRRYAPEALTERFEEAGFTVERCFRWGFPLVGLYHRHVYLPMLARKRGPAGPMPAWKRLASGLLAYAFRFDRLFDDHPGGIGLVLLAKKPV